jgi:hypothetical protein
MSISAKELKRLTALVPEKYADTASFSIDFERDTAIWIFDKPVEGKPTLVATINKETGVVQDVPSLRLLNKLDGKSRKNLVYAPGQKRAAERFVRNRTGNKWAVTGSTLLSADYASNAWNVGILSMTIPELILAAKNGGLEWDEELFGPMPEVAE